MKGGEKVMGKVIDISDKLSLDRPAILVKGKQYTINNGAGNFALMIKKTKDTEGNIAENMLDVVELALGKEASTELDLNSWVVENLKVLWIAILAAIQNEDYEVIEARFQENK